MGFGQRNLCEGQSMQVSRRCGESESVTQRNEGDVPFACCLLHTTQKPEGVASEPFFRSIPNQLHAPSNLRLCISVSTLSQKYVSGCSSSSCLACGIIEPLRNVNRAIKILNGGRP